MAMPEFPQEFVDKHCRKVREAAYWRKHLKIPTDVEELRAYAECAFISAGAGLICENCQLFMTRPYCGHKLDEEWLPKIEMDEWEKAEKERNRVEVNLGLGI